MCGSWYFPMSLFRDGVIDLNIHGLLDSPGDAICLPAYDGEAIHADKMSHGLAVLVDREGGSEVFFEPVLKGPSWFPYVLLAICLGAFVPVDYPTLLDSWVFILGGH